MPPPPPPDVVFANFVETFSRPLVTLFYVVGGVLLGIHLYHGIWSMFQSLGINNPRFNIWRRYLASALSVVLTVGFISAPLAVAFGIVG